MMSRKTRQRGILLAILVGVVSLLVSWLGPLAAARKVTRVVVAAHTLAAGTVLTAADVTTAPYAGAAPAGYLTRPAAVVRRVLAHDVVAGQPLLAADLQTGAAQQGLVPGQVGVMVPVSLAASGGVRPGETVDVIWAGSTAAGGNGNTGLMPGTTLLQGARVLAVVTSTNTPVQAATGSAGQTVGGYGSTVPAAVELAVPAAAAGRGGGGGRPPGGRGVRSGWRSIRGPSDRCRSSRRPRRSSRHRPVPHRQRPAIRRRPDSGTAGPARLGPPRIRADLRRWPRVCINQAEKTTITPKAPPRRQHGGAG
jgi:Flp pilus assembly protein CpaB